MLARTPYGDSSENGSLCYQYDTIQRRCEYIESNLNNFLWSQTESKRNRGEGLQNLALKKLPLKN